MAAGEISGKRARGRARRDAARAASALGGADACCSSSKTAAARAAEAECLVGRLRTYALAHVDGDAGAFMALPGVSDLVEHLGKWAAGGGRGVAEFAVHGARGAGQQQQALRLWLETDDRVGRACTVSGRDPRPRR